METRIQQWGNSLALRIPKVMADEIGIARNSYVELSLRDQQLVIEPKVKPKLSLAELLDQVTASNLHREQDTGLAVGGEIW